MVTIFERAMTTTVNDIEHIESQSYNGVSVTRVYFQPNAKVELALAQITAISQTLLRPFPPGTTPPSIIKYDASSVPILQLGLESTDHERAGAVRHGAELHPHASSPPSRARPCRCPTAASSAA